MIGAHRCGPEQLTILERSTSSVTDGNVINLSSTHWWRWGIPGEPMPLLMVKVGIYKQRCVVRTSVDRAVTLSV